MEGQVSSALVATPRDMSILTVSMAFLTSVIFVKDSRWWHEVLFSPALSAAPCNTMHHHSFGFGAGVAAAGGAAGIAFRGLNESRFACHCKGTLTVF